MRRTTIQLAGIAAVLLFTLSGYGQQRKNKFEIALGLNAVDVYLNNGFGLNAKAEESFISDIFTTNDWNINSKARDTYTDEGNKESAMPPISLRAAYYFSDQLALGLHFSANYLDIIDLCYNAVGLPDMDFTNFEGFLRFSPIQDTKIEPYGQLTLGQSWVGPRSNMHAGLDLGATLWLSDHIGLGYTAGVRTMFGTDLSEYLQHTLELVVRLDGLSLGSLKRDRATTTATATSSSLPSSTTLNLPPSYIDEKPAQVERLGFYERYPFLIRDIAKVSRGIFFDYKSAELSPEVTDFILPEVITELNKRPNLKITVKGHADPVGSEGYNYKLSLSRAQAVADFLIEGAIDPQRITVRALGENEPVMKSEREAALNRRVVITEDKE
jgi:outer membrane protein OmpA-like peptidoglycan-associated protein